jgi:hypothetical protein
MVLHDFWIVAHLEIPLRTNLHVIMSPFFCASEKG